MNSFLSIYICTLAISLLLKGGIGIAAHSIVFLTTGMFYLAERKKNNCVSCPLVCMLLLTLLYVARFAVGPIYTTGYIETGSLMLSSLLIYFGIQYGSELKLIEKIFQWVNNISLVTFFLAVAVYFVMPYERFAGTFYNFSESYSAFPNAFADFAILTLPASVLCFKKSRIARFVLCTTTCGILLTESQGGIIALALTVVLLSPIILTKKHFTYIIAGCLLAALLYTTKSFVNDGYFLNLDKNVKNFEQVQSVNTRFDHYKTAIQLIKEKLLFGYGPDSYQFTSLPYLSFLNTASHPHNVFLKVIVEVGMIGGVLLFVLLFYLLRFGWFFYQQKSDKLVIVICCLTFLAHQMIDYNLNFVSSLSVFSLYLGILGSDTKFKISSKTLQRISSITLLIFSITLITYSLIELSYKTHISSLHFENNSSFQNPYDADKFATVGDFQKAYKLNPHNLLYLLGFVENSKSIAMKTVKVDQILHNYHGKLRVNANHTILTMNPLAAIAIAHEIGKHNLAKNIDDTFQIERKKFLKLYHLDKLPWEKF